MCFVEIWTFSECGCRFDHHITCDLGFPKESSSDRAQCDQIQLPPAIPAPSRPANNGDYAWSSADQNWQGTARQCSIRRIEHRIFREPICDDCLLEELGLNKKVGQLLESFENGLDGAEWLLESKIEIEIDQAGAGDPEGVVSLVDLADEMQTPRAGTGFESLGEGDADDEDELDGSFRGRSTRRSAIDINRNQLRVAKPWSNWTMETEDLSHTVHEGKEDFRRKKCIRPLSKRLEGADLKDFTDKAKRGLKLAMGRARMATSNAKSEASRSPAIINRIRSVFDLRNPEAVSAAHESKSQSAAPRILPSSRISNNFATSPKSEPSSIERHVFSAVSSPPEQLMDIETITPTSISSSAAYDIHSNSSDMWDPHLRQELRKGIVNHRSECAQVNPEHKSEFSVDQKGEGRQLLLRATPRLVASTLQNPGSVNCVGLTDKQRVNEELAMNQSIEYEIGYTTSASSSGLPREVSTVDMDDAIPHTVRPRSHAQKLSASSLSSFTTAFSHSPQTSPPRPVPRMRQNLSFSPRTSMLQIATSNRPIWFSRDTSFQSPPSSHSYSTGLKPTSMQCEDTKMSVCIHEYDCCALCGDKVGKARVKDCVCSPNVCVSLMEDCQAEKPVETKKIRMEVCDNCS